MKAEAPIRLDGQTALTIGGDMDAGIPERFVHSRGTVAVAVRTLVGAAFTMGMRLDIVGGNADETTAMYLNL